MSDVEFGFAGALADGKFWRENENPSGDDLVFS
jgi:hypothetical protein